VHKTAIRAGRLRRPADAPGVAVRFSAPIIAVTHLSIHGACIGPPQTRWHHGGDARQAPAWTRQVILLRHAP
jgi:hypothetical protein